MNKNNIGITKRLLTTFLKKQINAEYMDCWSYTINHIPPFIFKDTRVISNPYTLDRDPCPFW